MSSQRYPEEFKTEAVKQILDHGHSVANVSLAKLRPLPFPLPPEAEQSRIVTRVTQLRRLCFELRQRLAEREAVQARLAEALVQQVA